MEYQFPKIILSERSKIHKQFLERVMEDNMDTLAMISIYYSQVYGQTKIVNKCLKGFLPFYSSKK
jgi:hypothetical protein